VHGAATSVCVLDTRGDYARFKAAVVFGSLEQAARDRRRAHRARQARRADRGLPRRRARGERHEFVEQLLVPLRLLREATGRPHWIVVDEASDMLAASAHDDDSPGGAAEKHDLRHRRPTALAPAILAAVHGFVACGPGAGAMIEPFAAAVSWGKPALPEHAPARARGAGLVPALGTPGRPGNTARVKARSGRPVKARPARKKPEVGQVLRRA
jgi:hypothetical protein